jgi:hypothetical protein
MCFMIIIISTLTSAYNRIVYLVNLLIITYIRKKKNENRASFYGNYGEEYNRRMCQNNSLFPLFFLVKIKMW